MDKVKLHGMHGLQLLIAKHIATQFAKPVEIERLASWLFPGWLEWKEQERLELLPESLRDRDRDTQDEYLRRHGNG